ncbi:hypothetical protein VCV18_000619 [Metarhizium anisopliae]
MQAQHLYERIESRTLLLALRTIEPRDAPRHYGHFDRLPYRGQEGADCRRSETPRPCLMDLMMVRCWSPAGRGG